MTMRVSLAQAREQHVPSAAPDAIRPLLSAPGANVVLGTKSERGAPAEPIVPAAHTLFGPRGALLADRHGPLIVCDTGHHRLLIWKDVPDRDNSPADVVIGQPDFVCEGRNARGEPGAASLNVPTGIAMNNGVLAVADAWNHRVLIWHGPPSRANQSADVVLGQPDFVSVQPNRGLDVPCAETLNWCYGVAIDAGRVFVADTGNRRVLVWDSIPTRNGAPADLVLGQREFGSRHDGAGNDVDAAGMRWPHAIAVAGDALFIADAGSSRIMAWPRLPRSNGAPCAFVLGQGDFHAHDHNRGGYSPTAATLNMPYGLSLLGDTLVVADTANSRLLGYELATLATGRPANRLAGQPTFADKGDNRWHASARDSLCWPYAVATCGPTAVIADSGNNRVLLWGAA